jgi:uncharacterized protein
MVESMNWKTEYKYLLLIVTVFLGCFFLPIGPARFDNSLLEAFIFRKEEKAKVVLQMVTPEEDVKRPLWKTSIYFAAMIGVLVFANWGRPQETTGIWAVIFAAKWPLTAFFAAALGLILISCFQMRPWKVGLTAIPAIALAIVFQEQTLIFFTAGFIGPSVFISTDKGEIGGWFFSSWTFAKQIQPLLLFGVLVAGLLLGRVGHEGIIPSEWVARAVGGNSLVANFFASFAGALMFNTVLGIKKTMVFSSLVAIFFLICRLSFGSVFG